MITVDDLKPAPYNPREITAEALAGLGFSMNEFGDIAGITWNRRTGHLVSGHQRVDYLKSKGAAFLTDPPRLVVGSNEFPVRVVDWVEDKEKAANVAANNPCVSGDFTSGAKVVLDDIRDAFGDEFFNEGLFGGVLDLPGAKEEPVEIVEDETPETPKNPITKLGDVWKLGKHVLYCKDIREGIGDLFGDTMGTDPPYGVSYKGKTSDALEIQNDNLKGEEFEEFIGSVFDSAFSSLRDGAYCYASVPAGPLLCDFLIDWKRRGALRQVLVWVKDSMVLGRSEYHYRHEPIMFGWKPGGERRVNADRTRTSVLEYARPKASKDHPTTKPVGLFGQIIKDSTDVGDIVIDPFLGSGTTLIAAEQLGRVCHGTEIEPAYCDVIVERWQNLTGKDANRG